MEPIQKVAVGSPRTLLCADLANQIIEALNIARNVKLEPDSIGEILQADKTIIDLVRAAERLRIIEARINNPNIRVTCGVGTTVNVEITF